MEPVEKPTSRVSETLTWTEICERYPDQELCLVEVEYADPARHVIQTARVIGHGTIIEEADDHHDPITVSSTRRPCKPSHEELLSEDAWPADEPVTFFYFPRLVYDAETGELLSARSMMGDPGDIHEVG